MDEFIRLTEIGDLESGAMLEVELDGHPLLVARVGDAYYVTDARCPHLGGHLAKGALEGSVVTCPRHHSQFDLKDGSCLRWTDWKGTVLSIAELAKHPRPLRAYDCRTENGVLFLGPEKPPGATPA